MANKLKLKKRSFARRKKSIKNKLTIGKYPRLVVYRSNVHLYAQLIDDNKGITLASSSSIEKTIKDQNLKKREIAELIGKNIAKKIISKGIDKVAFDRGKYKYHGRVKQLAESAKKGGLKF